MTILVTGSSGHLGEALMRTLRAQGRAAIGIDIKPSPFTDRVGSISDAAFVVSCIAGVTAVLHTATLHKPHVETHTRQQFVDTNVSGTLTLLEAASQSGVRAFIYTSTTSAFGAALTPPPTAPAAWITEDVVPVSKNIYGATKLAAEDLCQLFHRLQRLPCLVLRTSRFFPEDDDAADARAAYSDANLKLNEFLHRRVEIEDVVGAHLLAIERAPAIGFGRYIISATTPFTPDDAAALRRDPAAVLRERVPQYAAEYARRGWRMASSLDRVYDNSRARRELGWQPRWDFATLIARLARDEDDRSALARAVGRKPYHDQPPSGDGPYPVGIGHASTPS
ncbi:MAG: NAD(P)-dependent oxidoreductase [Gammaproteobacteria bacterium]|nr:NAD(P)-dependent oxidoreductase [Gammaproteobacteria bacterium]